MFDMQGRSIIAELHVNRGGNFLRVIHPRGENVVKQRFGQVEQWVMPPAKSRIKVHQPARREEHVAVVGVESEELGTEVPRAYVVRKGGMKAIQRGDEERTSPPRR